MIFDVGGSEGCNGESRRDAMSRKRRFNTKQLTMRLENGKR